MLKAIAKAIVTVAVVIMAVPTSQLIRTFVLTD
jgi:hypothetical protein